MRVAKFLFHVLVIAVVIVFFLFITNLLTSCSHSKRIVVSNRDSSYLSKRDTGQIKKSEVSNENQWWREVINFPKDSVYIEKSIPYPIQIIREGGSQKSKESNYDSSWKQGLDSLSSKISNLDKKGETKVLSVWQILFLCIGVFLVFRIIEKGGTFLSAAFLKRN